MNADQVNINEESARQQWQNVIAFDTDHGAVPKINVKKDRNQLIFEVLP